jgi:predicted metal-dependent hydrolase
VTIPRGGSQREARLFATQHAAWIEQQRYRRLKDAQTRAVSDGGTVLFRGVRVAVERHQAGQETIRLQFADQELEVPADTADGRPFIVDHLRQLAARELPPLLLELAATQQLTVGRVSVRNQRSRWGSCSRRGYITLNWRLVQMPETVRDYVLWHELMHLREASHQRRFWGLVEQVCPGYREARAWLTTHQEALA